MFDILQGFVTFIFKVSWLLEEFVPPGLFGVQGEIQENISVVYTYAPIVLTDLCTVCVLRSSRRITESCSSRRMT